MGLFTTPFAGAIANAEGFGVEGAIPTRANNPGDLAIGDIGYGTIGQGITVFPSLEAGVQALEKQVARMVGGTSTVYNPDMTIAQAGSIYANGDPNWAKNVASYLGVQPSTTLGDAGKSTGPSVNGSVPWSEMSTEQMQQAIMGRLGTATTGTQDKAGTFNVNYSRIVSIVAGLITIGAGLFMFKPVRDVSIEFTKGAVKGAAAVA